MKERNPTTSLPRPFWQRHLPLDWTLWPAEARLLLTLTAIWSLAGLLVLASASWWVAAREQGEGAYYLKRQLVWMTASWSPTTRETHALQSHAQVQKLKRVDAVWPWLDDDCEWGGV